MAQIHQFPVQVNSVTSLEDIFARYGVKGLVGITPANGEIRVEFQTTQYLEAFARDLRNLAEDSQLKSALRTTRLGAIRYLTANAA